MSVELTQRIIHVKDNGTYDSLDIFRGAPGEKGDTGRGLIPGGSTGQVLKKKSGTDYDTEWANDASAVTDVQVNGTSILNNGVANVPIGDADNFGVFKRGTGLDYSSSTGKTSIAYSSSTQTKNGTNATSALNPSHQHESTFYGLAKAAGDSTQSASDNAVGTYTEGAKTAIKSMIGVNVEDVQVNGTSVVSQGVANVPLADAYTAGVLQIGADYGITKGSGARAYLSKATDAQLKAGEQTYKPVVSSNAHVAAFYGLAKAASDTTQSASSNPVGMYTDAAKAAIKSMLGIDAGMQEIIISGQDPVITGIANARYNCGEVYTISITPPASGIVDVVFTSGSTAALLTLPVTVKMPVWFDATALETNTIYEITITDGVYGMVMSWPQ